MIWHDGGVAPDDSLRVGIDDRVFEHGLGLFETFRTWSGGAPLLARHLARLRESAAALGIDLAGVALPDARAVADLLAAAGVGRDALLRLTLTGGSESGRPLAWLKARPLPEAEALPLSLTTEVAAVIDGETHRHKMLNYWERRRAYARAVASGHDETLLQTPKGRVLEASRSSVLLIPAGRPGAIATPSRGPIVAGVMRDFALEVAEGAGYRVERRVAWVGELRSAAAVFLANSVRGVRLVGSIDGADLAEGSRLPLSRLLCEDLPRLLREFPRPDETPR